jgi:Rrf2 family protein
MFTKKVNNMFSISVKARYGITAMLELARHYGYDLVQAGDVVDKHDLPRNYLEQIFNRLGKQGLVRSVRGKNGGYALAEDPSELTVFAVLEALEGEMELQTPEPHPVLRQLYGEVQEDIRLKLSMSLARVLELQRQHAQQVMYHI